jgi:hypothetical protein
LGKGELANFLSQIELDEDSNTVGDRSIHYHIKIHTKHNLIKCLNSEEQLFRKVLGGIVIKYNQNFKK